MEATDPGPRDHLITRSLERDLAGLDPELVNNQALDPAEAPDRLARHAMDELRRGLRGDDSADAQAERVNEALRRFTGNDGADAEVAIPARVLEGIKGRSPLGDVMPLPPNPATPFAQSDLLVNAEGQPNVGSELRADSRARRRSTSSARSSSGRECGICATHWPRSRPEADASA